MTRMKTTGILWLYLLILYYCILHTCISHGFIMVQLSQGLVETNVLEPVELHLKSYFIETKL